MNRCLVSTVLVLCLSLPLLVLGASGQETAPAAIPTAQIAATAGENPVVAKVLGESITEKQVMEAINQMASQRPMQREQMQQKNVALYKDALDTLIGFVLLKNEAKEMNITVEKAKVDETWQNMRKRFPSEDQYKQALVTQGLTETDLRTKIEENLLYQQVIEKAVASLPGPTDAEVQKFYDENPKFFAIPLQVHAAHILLKFDAAATAEQKAELKKKLEGIRADIESKKITFAEAAKNSDDKSNAQKGGDLGFFPRGKMVKPFDEAAFAAAPGTMTDIVETQFGYHLINVIESKPAGQKTLAESKKDIQNFLDRKSKQEAVKAHIEGLKEKAKVETVMTSEEWNKRHTAK